MINNSIAVSASDNKGLFITISEAAKQLRVSQATIWRWIDAGRLPAYRIGPRRILIKRQDLELVVQPVRGKEARDVAKETKSIWAGYDPQKVREAVAQTTGAWADLDTDELITELYRAREEGSRPDSRP